MSLNVRVNNTNTSTVVINVSSLGDKYIKKAVLTTTGLVDLSSGDIVNNSVVQLVYDTSTGCFQAIAGLVKKSGAQYDYTFTTSTGLIYNIPYYMATKEDVLIMINGIPLYPADYSISGNSLTFGAGVMTAGDLVFMKIRELYSNTTTINPTYYSFTTSIGLIYTLSFTPISKSSLIVTCNGQVMHPDDYSVTNATLTFVAGAVESTDVIVVYNTTSSKSLDGAYGRVSDYAITATASMSYTLPYTPISKSSMLVIVNSVVVHPNDYTLSNGVITFGAGTIILGDIIVIKIIDPVITISSTGGFIDAPADNLSYVRKNSNWSLGVEEALSDSKQYVRKNAAWSEVVIPPTSPVMVTANTGTGYSIDLALGTCFNLTLTGGCTFTFPTTGTAATMSQFWIYLNRDATPSRTVTWPTNTKWSMDIVPALDGTASTLTIFRFTQLGNTNRWYGECLGMGYVI